MASRRHILIGDDHAPSARACRAALEAEGFSVALATTLDEVSRLAADARPDCLVLDAGLPGGDLLDLCSRLRRPSRERSGVSALLLVPPRFPPARLDRLRPLVDDCLFKPFHVAELVDRAGRLASPSPQAIYASASGTAGKRDAAAESAAPGLLRLSGQVVGGCRLERILGKGATGIVYLGRHLALDIPVAVKLLSEASGPWRREDLQRFARGARAAAKVQHPNVVPVLHAGSDGTRHFLVQRYVEGETLRQRMDAQGKLPEQSVRRVLREIGAGLAAAHRLDLVHRDVKPANIIVTPSGRSVLTDFGFARRAGLGDISSESAAIGTPYYMSPEQCDGRALDGRSDLYSLGATAYHALSGAPPIQGDTPIAVLRGHLERDPRPLRDVRKGLANVVTRLLAKAPEGRFQTGEELLEALDRIEKPG